MTIIKNKGTLHFERRKPLNMGRSIPDCRRQLYGLDHQEHQDYQNI